MASQEDAWEDVGPENEAAASAFVGFAMPPNGNDPQVEDDSDDYEDPVNPMRLAWTAPVDQRRDRGRGQASRQRQSRGGASKSSHPRHAEDDGGRGRQALPVAKLPETWDGVPTNGAEFLAMMRAAERNLPFSTQAPHPKAQDANPPCPAVESRPSDLIDHDDMDLESDSSDSSSDSLQGPFPTIMPSAGPSRSRHPALPTPEWQTAFGRHFIGYRARLAAQQPTDTAASRAMIASLDVKPPLGSRSKLDWGAYINGAKRRKVYVGASKESKGSKLPTTIPDGSEEDEEAAMNEGFVQDAAPLSVKNNDKIRSEANASNGGVHLDSNGLSDGEEDEVDVEDEIDEEESDDDLDIGDQSDRHVLEAELPKHRPAEPLTSVIRAMSQDDVHFLLGCFSRWLENNLATAADPPYLVSTSDEAPETYTLPPNINPQVLDTPLLPLHARWIFALLLRVDAQLLGSDVSDLRDLAKLCMNVVRWQVYTRRLEAASDPAAQGSALDQERMRISCWMIHQAVSAGWAQHDLLEDADSIFGGMPLSGTE